MCRHLDALLGSLKWQTLVIHSQLMPLGQLEQSRCLSLGSYEPQQCTLLDAPLHFERVRTSAAHLRRHVPCSTALGEAVQAKLTKRLPCLRKRVRVLNGMVTIPLVYLCTTKHVG